MRLKTLEIQGYKSFAVKSIFHFNEGITAIVGPNGSGKSNVSDAIRWALGEQSYSNLRGQRTADMIFAGSSNRARMGMASVSIVLDNTDGSLPLDYSEVTITRRAYRSGENEYLVNNNRVRLKDVAAILARGGLARQTYTSIGQGTIDRALSLRAEERRQLFEEAAGITYHRQRRAQTLDKLEETHANLLRVNDIAKEIEPRLRRLEKQAARVEKYQVISLHLTGLLKVWYGYQWREKQEALRLAQIRATAGEQRLAEERQQLAKIENEIKALRARQTEIRAQLGNWHADSSHLHRQAETLQRELAVGEERARHLAAQREEFISEVQLLEAQLKEQQETVQQAQQTLAEINTAYQTAENELAAAKKNLNAHEQQRQTVQHQHAEARRRVERASHAITDRQSRLAQLSERKSALQAQKDTQQAAIAKLNTQKTETEQKLQAVQSRLAEIDAALAELDSRETSLRQQMEALQTKAKSLAENLSEQEKALASLQARQDLLGKLRGDMSGYFQGVKAVLQHKSLPGIRGTVAQLMQVPAELETAFEMALGGKLQDVVVDSWENAETAIEHLKKTQGGRATFLPLDRIRPPKRLSVPEIDGVIGLAVDLVDFDEKNRAAVESMLNRLLITKNLSAARRAFDRLSGNFQIATRSGEIARSGGSITGGKTRRKEQGGILAREREWRELPNQIAKVTTAIETLRRDLEENSAAQNSLSAQLKDLAKQRETLKTQQTAVQKESAAHEKTLSDIGNQIGWHNDLLAQANTEMEAGIRRESELRAEIAKLETEQAEAEAAVAKLAETLASLSAETLQAAVSEAQSQLTLIGEKRRNQQSLLKNYTQSHHQLQTQLQNRQSRIAALAEQRANLLTRLEAQRQEHATLMEAIKTFTDQIEPAEALLAEMEAEQIAKEAEEAQHRERLRRAETEHNHFTLDLARRQDEVDALRRQIEDDFGLVQFEIAADQVGQPVLPLDALVTDLPVVESVPEGIEADIRRLKVQLRQLGHINFEAPNEYRELQERHDFLVSQLEDLEKASHDLKEIIKELDGIIEEAFIKTFESVAKEFQNYFKILFGGGEAKLNLTNPEDITHTGVEIVARPPGKRPQNLELLSGGERSLTAQALIFALLKTSPTPYCVFDEVDAMLDEANVDRFRSAITDLSREIQFIIITHNRKTIEIADTVYGISMGNDGVSRMVSLKLDELSEKIAA